MNIEELKIAGYERVVHARDPEHGLNAFIAVHNTTLGPALGGLRMWPYKTEQEALTDVLRLAEGMTYKSAIAQTGLGGGKSVIIGEPKVVKTPALLQAMGRFIDSLGGLYITAEDVNIGIADLEEVHKTTRHVTGLAREKGFSGNPSPYTAKGVFLGIRVCLKEVFGSDDPKGRHVAIQGAGSVAQGVIESLLQAGAKVTCCDINAERVIRLKTTFPAIQWVDADKIFDVECDVFAPCALGAVINDNSLPRLKCRIVAGAANNQLAEARHGKALKDKGILYAPDYVINAGGIINVSCELDPQGYSESKALAKIANIERAMRDIFAESRQANVSTADAALAVARRILAS